MEHIIPRKSCTVAEACASLGISKATGYAMIHTGELPSVRLGGRILVPIAALDRLVALDGDGGQHVNREAENTGGLALYRPRRSRP